MAYRKIDPRLWDDERFVELTPVHKLLWLYLLTGPHTTSLPGLWIIGAGELVDGLRLPARTVDDGLRKLEAMGRLALNPRLRLVRVPNAPRYNRPDNARVVKAWFKLWSDIPECQQKYDHLEGIRASVFSPIADDGAGDGDEQNARGQALVAAWKALFGSVRVPAKYMSQALRRAGYASEPCGAGSDEVRDESPKSSRTVPEARANSSPALVTASGSSDLSPDGEAPPETARARQSASMGLEAAALLAKLRAHDCLRTIATRGTAEGLAAQVVSGRVALAQAERAIDDAGFKYAVEREQPGGSKSPPELGSYVAGCVGRGGKSQRGTTVPFRGPQPQPGPAWIDPAKKNPNPVSPEEQERPLV